MKRNRTTQATKPKATIKSYSDRRTQAIKAHRIHRLRPSWIGVMGD